MASAAAKDLPYPHISKTPGVCGGKACIDGTRIRVMDIVVLEEKGLRPEEMLNQYGRPLSLAEVHAALAYYHDHPEEIAQSFADEDAFVEELERERAEFLARR